MEISRFSLSGFTLIWLSACQSGSQFNFDLMPDFRCRGALADHLNPSCLGQRQAKPQRIAEFSRPVSALRLRGGMPNVGMENWTSDFDRMCWNESNPDILSPLFVPKGNWTEEDFDNARRNPAFQDETSQKLIQCEYERLNGEDPWRGQRGEADIWGANPLANIPGNSAQGILQDPHLTLTLQAAAYQVTHWNQSFRAIEVVSLLGALQALGVISLPADVPTLFPLREDEYKGPDWRSPEQRDAAVATLRDGLVAFLGPSRPPTLEAGGDVTLGEDLWDPPEWPRDPS